MSTNERVKQVRQALNLSQAKFAKAIPVSSGYIGSIENGKRKANDRIIKLICSAFNVRETWLRTGEGDMFDDVQKQYAEMATANFKELKPDYQELILKHIDMLLSIQDKEKGE